jgi:hypothetical protein
LEPEHFVDQLHRDVWRCFKTQLLTTGNVDPVITGRKLDCNSYLLERGLDASTTAHAHVEAGQVRDAARARRVYEICQRGCAAIINGNVADVVLAKLRIAIDSMQEPAT